MIPLFQRVYSWKQDNWETLWDDIIETRDMEVPSKHFLGSIVTKSIEQNVTDGVMTFLVIDGQQRLTTLPILLAALRDVAEKHDPQLAGEIDERYLINKYAKDQLKHYKVLPTQTDRPAYFAVINKEIPQTPTTAIHHAYYYFLNAFRKAAEAPGTPLQRLKE